MTRKVLAVLAVAVFACTMAYAQDSGIIAGQAVSHVYLNVNPTIAVQPVDAVLQLGTIGTGEIGLPITFRIDANTEAVAMSAEVTDLYKGNTPSSEVAPIEVVIDEGVLIEADAANEIAGGDGVPEYISNNDKSTPNGVFQAHQTQLVTFESGQNNHFSQNVYLTPVWGNDDSEKPVGEYSGFVYLYASVVI